MARLDYSRKAVDLVATRVEDGGMRARKEAARMQTAGGYACGIRMVVECIGTGRAIFKKKEGKRHVVDSEAGRICWPYSAQYLIQSEAPPSSYERLNAPARLPVKQREALRNSEAEDGLDNDKTCTDKT